MPFSNSSVLLQKSDGTTEAFLTNQSSSAFSYTFASNQTGTISYCIDREGYEAIVGNFALGSGSIALSVTQALRQTATGDQMYTGTTSNLIDVSFDISTPGSERCFIEVGDGDVTAQTVIDEIEDALASSENGCRFLLAVGGSQCDLAELAGQTYLLLGNGYRIKRRNANDANATVNAFLISADGQGIDTSNGSVAVLTSPDISAQLLSALASYDVSTFDPTSDTIEGTLTHNAMMKLQTAALTGKVSGSPDGPIVIKGVDGSTTRISATVDEDGNRTAVTLTP